jgi:K(+)-stimulated pyrophosphate-energized sodium pump
VQAQLLVWIFAMRIVMVLVSGGSYLINEAIAKSMHGNADKFNFEKPLQMLVWLTSILSIIFTYIASYLLIPELAATTPCGGSWRRSSAAERQRARSFRR